MYLTALLAAPFAAALLACFGSGRDGAAASRLALVLALVVAALGVPLVTCLTAPAEVEHAWFALVGTNAVVQFSLASDGLTAWLIQLVTFLVPVALLASRDQVGERMREFAVAVLVMEGLMIGALLARDLVLFYVCFEAMLIPMVVLMALFGGADRRGAALQFFLYTMLGSVGLLVAIWYIAQNLQTTSLKELIDHGMLATLERGEQLALFAAFALAFAVKVPLAPFHGWQARAYAECPTGAVVLLSGAMAKLGTYGLIRFVLPLFPALSVEYANWFIVLGLIGVIAGALMAWAATDVKRLIAFSSLSHLGLVVVGIFTFSDLALKGAAVQMVAHGISVAALFVLVGAIESRSLKRGLDDFGGLAGRMPILATLFIAAVLASAALPGTANFAGEFLLLMGIFDPKQWWIAAIAGLSTILTAIYLLRLVQRWFYGPRRADLAALPDLGVREVVAVAPLIALSLCFGLYPKPISDQAGVTASKLGAEARRIASGAPAPVAVVETKDAHAAR